MSTTSTRIPASLRTAANEALAAWSRAGRAARAAQQHADATARDTLDRLLAGEITIEVARDVRGRTQRAARVAGDEEVRLEAAYRAALAKIEAVS